MRKPHGDAEQACFTTAVMVSGFSCIRVIFIQIGCLCKVDHAYHGRHHTALQVVCASAHFGSRWFSVRSSLPVTCYITCHVM